jgi:hypothetical protein
LQGNDIEANTRDELCKLVGDLDCERIALTDAQVDQYDLRHLVIPKLDNRFKPPREHDAVECETLSQSVIIDIVRTALDDALPNALADVARREERERAALRRLLNNGRR